MNTIHLYELKKIQSDFPKQQIKTSERAAVFIKQFYGDDMEIFESFFILLLNRNNETIGYAKISQGGTAGTVVDTKIIAKYAVDSLAHGVILAHNHPSGNKQPSTEDVSITNKVKKALELLDIIVLDHIIMTSSEYYSMQDNGLI